MHACFFVARENLAPFAQPNPIRLPETQIGLNEAVLAPFNDALQFNRYKWVGHHVDHVRVTTIDQNLGARQTPLRAAAGKPEKLAQPHMRHAEPRFT
jgi:hypothetical protein